LLYFGWVLPYGVLTVALGIAYLRFWWALPPKTRWRSALAGILYVGGALGLEAVGGRYLHAQGGRPDLTYALITTCEELLEMIGASLFLHTLVQHAAEAFGVLTVSLTSAGPGGDGIGGIRPCPTAR
jgi:hypothetical protein